MKHGKLAYGAWVALLLLVLMLGGLFLWFGVTSGRDANLPFMYKQQALLSPCAPARAHNT